jgi:hypothetical protein
MKTGIEGHTQDMTINARAELITRYSVFAVMAAVLFVQILARRALFADGSFQLLNLLEVENARFLHPGGTAIGLFHELVTRNNEPSRFFTYLFTELPTILALRAGVTDLNVLINVFSSWMLAAPLLFWGIALWKVRKEILFWPFVMMFAFVYFNGNFFIIGEYNLAFGLEACCLALLLRKEANTPIDYAVLFASAFLSIMSYPSSMFMGALLGGLSLAKLKHEPSRAMRYFWIALVVCFAVSIADGVWNYVAPALPENAEKAHDLKALMDDLQFWVVLVCAVLMGSSYVIRAREWSGMTAILLAGIAFVFLVGDLHATPAVGFRTRAFTAPVFFGFGVAVSLFKKFAAKLSVNESGENPYPAQYFALPVFALFVVLSFLDIQSSIEFRRYLGDYSRVVNTHSGLLRFEDSIARIPNTDIYGWDWIYPSLGLLLRKNTDSAVILDPDFQRGKWKPFDPAVSVPDLGRYYAGGSLR